MDDGGSILDVTSFAVLSEHSQLLSPAWFSSEITTLEDESVRLQRAHHAWHLEVVMKQSHCRSTMKCQAKDVI
ncbi:hypothetical protein NDU88_007880 [Pleurodeles waltl]|uniref:Uncharacterized protein n=1 Tax=Pleurodeles waltl TaxID=8319 RepID=A0AAV7NXL2_PLEWA|nr:hypothetical protein NDU88_007880 [Pleurodeles waltl]